MQHISPDKSLKLFANFKLAVVLSVFCVVCVILCGCSRHRPVLIRRQQRRPAEKYIVRVLLLDDVDKCTVGAEAGFRITDPQNKSTQYLSEPGKKNISISIAGGKFLINNKPTNSSRLQVTCAKPEIFHINSNYYRGKLKLLAGSNAKSFDAVNVVELEQYLMGVVGAEMPGYWESAALEAQAVAARTYCLYIMKRFGRNRGWDVKATQANQVYKGISAEAPPVTRAVNKTKGAVLVCRQGSGGKAIFPTYYSSSCGGHTANSENVFGDSFEPLIGVECPYCVVTAKAKNIFWKAVRFDKNVVTKKLVAGYPNLRALGEIVDIVPVKVEEYGSYSRIASVKLVGKTGKSDSLRAEDMRLTIDPTGRKIKSTIFQIKKSENSFAFISGRGFGHGVGFCQCGAQQMAREGKKADQILKFYYPNSSLKNLY